MKLGIVGLPNVGKSTIFNALTAAGAESANYPFCTIDPNVGVVPVPDGRLDKLAQLVHPEKVTPTTIEFYDIAGLVKGASKGEGLGNKFLSHIREVEAIVHVVRCFSDDNIIHVEGSINPGRDIETINLELIFSDLEILQRRRAKTEKIAKSGDKIAKRELEILIELIESLESGNVARNISFPEEDLDFVKQLNLLTYKPVLYVANVSEENLLEGVQNNSQYKMLEKYVKQEDSQLIYICGKIEDEISQLDPSEKKEFLKELNLEQSGLDRLVKASYKLLDLISFLTAGPKEVRAWTIKKGTKAPQAAGKIHTDFERGFIRAEVISYENLLKCGSYSAARDKGLIRLEGKDYVMQDGDVVVFRFNV
ncbi:MAG: redox-regulated ATPase YchF [Clostridia bacterium]|nr:redox-regulated ATPase YchF [Clostridia bacterium]